MYSFCLVNDSFLSFPEFKFSSLLWIASISFSSLLFHPASLVLLLASLVAYHFSPSVLFSPFLSFPSFPSLLFMFRLSFTSLSPIAVYLDELLSLLYSKPTLLPPISLKQAWMSLNLYIFLSNPEQSITHLLPNLLFPLRFFQIAANSVFFLYDFWHRVPGFARN